MPSPCGHYLLMPHREPRRQGIYFCISCRTPFSVTMNDQYSREWLRAQYPTARIMRLIWWLCGPFLRRQRTQILEFEE